MKYKIFKMLYWTCIFVIMNFCLNTDGTYVIEALHMGENKSKDYQKKYYNNQEN